MKTQHCDQCKHAIKQARSAPVQEPVAQYSDIVSDGGLDPRNKFDAPPAAPVQEPVAWRYKQRFLKPHHNEWYYSEAFPELHATVSEPLYTTPPAAQRQWVGLTDEEWQDFSDRYGLILFGRFKNEIEAKLKEKNHD